MQQEQESKAPLAVVGGGFTGLAAAYELSNYHAPVIVFEAEEELGGLAGSFELKPGVWIEKFYHHWFTSDQAALDLISELGLKDKIKRVSTNTGLYYANSCFRLSSPWDLLAFKPLPLLDRLRTGLMALRARRITDWQALEGESAEEWMIRMGGRRAFEVIWRPLLQGKFGSEAEHISAVWFWNKLKLRGSSRSRQGGEELIYLEDGGFRAVLEALRAVLIKRGVLIKTKCAVQEIVSQGGAVSGVKTGGEFIPLQAVLAAVPLPVFLAITPALPREYREHYGKVRFLGNFCLVLRLRQSLSQTYWLNVADPSFPFVGIIEHTNFDRHPALKGEHVAYISKYLMTSDPLYGASAEELYRYCAPYIKKIFPCFSDEWVLGFKAWHAPYSQPIIFKHYSRYIPGARAPIKNLWLSTMAQIYPEDRGTNYGILHGRAAARDMAETLGLQRL